MEKINKKSKTIFIIIGYLTIILAAFTFFTFLLTSWGSYHFYNSLSLERRSSISASFMRLTLGGPLVLSILYAIQGYGLIKLKKWLPAMLLVCVIIAFCSHLYLYFTSIGFKINPVWAFYKFIIKDGIIIWLSLILIWFVYKKKQIFIN